MVIVLNHREGLTHTEIAATLDLPLGTVKSRLRYALDGMRAAIEADDRVSLAPAVGAGPGRAGHG